MYINIVDNSKVTMVKLINVKHVDRLKLGIVYQGVIYKSKSKKWVKGNLVNVLLMSVFTNKTRVRSMFEFQRTQGILVTYEKKEILPVFNRIHSELLKDSLKNSKLQNLMFQSKKESHFLL